MLSTPAEWEFAFQMLELAAGGENAIISTDWEPNTVRVERLRDQFNVETIADALRRQLITIMKGIQKNESTVTLEGPVNNFHFGPMIVGRLLSAYEDPDKSIDEILETVYSMMQIVNYIAVIPAFDGIRAAEIEVYDRANAKGEQQLAGVVQAGIHYFVPNVDSLVLCDSNGSRAVILAKYLKDFFAKHLRELEDFVWVDEYQFILNPLEHMKFDALVKAATKEFDASGKRRSGNLLNLFDR